MLVLERVLTPLAVVLVLLSSATHAKALLSSARALDLRVFSALRFPRGATFFADR